MNRIIMLLCAVSIILVGCGNGEENVTNEENTAANIKKNELVTTETKTDMDDDKYTSIEKIVIGQYPMINGFDAYKELNNAIILEIGKKYDIPVEIKKMSNADDAIRGIEDGFIDVVSGFDDNDNQNLETTYTYLSSPLYLPNGIEFASHADYRYGVGKDNRLLLDLLNEEINAMNENGELKKLREKYLSEREDKDHPTVAEVTSWSYLEKMSSEERDQLSKQLEEWSKIEE